MQMLKLTTNGKEGQRHCLKVIHGSSIVFLGPHLHWIHTWNYDIRNSDAFVG